MAVDLNDIKTQFKSILDSANTTTADYDLSEGMNTKVNRVMKINPLKIPVQPSFFPYVTIYADSKPIELEGMAGNLQKAKRSSEISFNVVGAVWEQIITDINVDEADEEIERLMENVEEIVRRNFKLNNTVQWSNPESVEYHSFALDEETHMRVGSMDLVCKVFY